MRPIGYSNKMFYYNSSGKALTYDFQMRISLTTAPNKDAQASGAKISGVIPRIRGTSRDSRRQTFLRREHRRCCHHWRAVSAPRFGQRRDQRLSALPHLRRTRNNFVVLSRAVWFRRQLGVYSHVTLQLRPWNRLWLRGWRSRQIERRRLFCDGRCRTRRPLQQIWWRRRRADVGL